MGKALKIGSVENELLEKILRLGGKELVELGMESEDDILDAIHKSVEEAQIHGREKLTFTLSFSVKVDLGKGEQENSLSWRVTHKTARLGSLMEDDPGQEKMEFGDENLT